MMNLERCGRKRSWPNLRYFTGIYLEALTKITKKKTSARIDGFRAEI
jgi:hypothetical protein